MSEIIVDNNLFRENPIRFKYYFDRVYSILSDLEAEYRHFDRWFHGTLLLGLYRAERCILVKEYNHEIVAVSILKRTPAQCKISTFRVIKKFQRFGLGQEMMIRSFDLLESDSPLMTVSSKRISEFQKILSDNSFEFFQEYPNYYKSNLSEISFNGPIETSIFSRQPSLILAK